MKRLSDLQEELGWSKDQALRRIRVLRDVLNGAVQRGPGGALLLDERAAALLKRVRELEDEGFAMSEAAAKVIAECDGTQCRAVYSASPAQDEAAGAPRGAGDVPWVLTAALWLMALAVAAIAARLWWG